MKYIMRKCAYKNMYKEQTISLWIQQLKYVFLILINGLQTGLQMYEIYSKNMFLDVWLDPVSVNQNQFIATFKQRLVDEYIQE